MKKIVLLIACMLSGMMVWAQNPVVVIHTTLGDIEIEVYEIKAPITARNFLMHIDKGTYTKSHFYRVVTDYNQDKSPIKIQVIQGGILKSESNLDSIPSIKHESTKETGILHKKGVMSMASSGPGTASTEFFICLEDEPELDFGGTHSNDPGFAAFGKVIKGMEVLIKIHQQPEENQYLNPKVGISAISRKE